MKISKTLLTAAALVASFGASASASAQVTGSIVAGPLGPFLALSAPAACTAGTPCTLGGSIGTIVGGTILAADRPFADIPDGVIFGGRFLSSGPSTTSPSTITFGPGLSSIGFLWGSPDKYNRLTVVSEGPNESIQTFTATGLGFPSTTGNQNVSTYVSFTADAGVRITQLSFSNVPTQDAFEVANFSTNVNVVPEPATYALMGTGLLALGAIAKRRKQA